MVDQARESEVLSYFHGGEGDIGCFSLEVSVGLGPDVGCEVCFENYRDAGIPTFYQPTLHIFLSDIFFFRTSN